MPKFKDGEYALLKANGLPLGIYARFDNTVVQVIHFVGLLEGEGNKDWYRIQLEDNQLAQAQEVVLHKLPDDYSPADCTQIFEKVNYRPPPKRVKAASVS